MIRKLVISNGQSERELVIAGRVVIGRDPSCQVCEPDPLLSRRHAEIVTGAQSVSIRDLSSRNGILVNGEKIREQVLLPGDVVQLGHLQLRYLEEEGQPLGRWTPEPTPLPGRRQPAATSAASSPLRSDTPIPRGRAGFEKVATRRPRTNTDTTAAGASAAGRRPPTDPHMADPDATQLNMRVDPNQTMAFPSSGGRGSSAAGDATVAASDGTLHAAISHLASVARSGSPRALSGARLVADAELTIVDATPECAELLGVDGESLVGDSLTDVFLRGIRRAYADPQSAVTFTVSRDDDGAIAVTLSLHTNGHE